jgi:hypothetical protein
MAVFLETHVMIYFCYTYIGKIAVFESNNSILFPFSQVFLILTPDHHRRYEVDAEPGFSETGLSGRPGSHQKPESGKPQTGANVMIPSFGEKIGVSLKDQL